MTIPLTNYHDFEEGLESLDQTMDEDTVMKFLVTKHNGVNKMGKQLKSYECGFCQKQLKQLGSIRGHMIRRHAKPSNQPCPECGKVFKSKLSLSNHLKFSQKCSKKFRVSDHSESN
jgi:hypothetical protein